MFRKTRTTFAGSFAAAHAKKSRPMIEELEDRHFLSATGSPTVCANEIGVTASSSISARASALDGKTAGSPPKPPAQ